MKNFEEKAIVDISTVCGGQAGFEVTATVEQDENGDLWARADFKWVQKK